MKNNYRWESSIGAYLSQYLADMRAAGYKFTAQERNLKQFDRYCAENKVQESTLSKKIVQAFCHGDDYDATSTRQKRVCLLRNLAEYMNNAGCEVYVHPKPDKSFRCPKHVPYIYSVKELTDIFTKIDTWKANGNNQGNRKIVDPLLFRMLYGCGLRISEALNLRNQDVDLDEGVLRIRQSKNNKDRLVPMSKTLTERCRDYSVKNHMLSSSDAYFFPGQHGKPFNRSTIYRRFRQYLWKAGISHSGNGPRIHDFRHAYCVHRLKKWVLDGKELTNLLPYLAAYLGHADFRGTEYYLRLTADLYPHIIEKIEVSCGYIIPELRCSDET